MLDRTIPFYNTILRCDRIADSDAVLPAGFTFASYSEGFEDEWAKIEYETGDFCSVEEAKRYFIDKYLSAREELINRGVFLFDGEKRMAGACIAWYDMKGCKSVASLHWLVVADKHQGKGLGRALLIRTMDIFAKRRETNVYIHTQPWSWKAILLYISMGFRLQKSDTFAGFVNQYGDSMKTLEKVVNSVQYRLMLNASQE